MNISQLKRLFYTTRHLRPVQFYSRFWIKIPKPRPKNKETPSLQFAKNAWVREIPKTGERLGENQFMFLNKIDEIDLEQPWVCNNQSLLWNYNLNYFDFLFDENKSDQGNILVEKWVQSNRTIKATPWSPYPSSLRIVNWIRFHLSGNKLSQGAIDSLALQVRNLSRNIEYHIQANHLLTNGKALLHAGLFFKGPEASEWLNKGLRILLKEIPEQTLEDGGNYELSPMYHAIVLKDLLDLINVSQCYETRSKSRIIKLTTMCEEYAKSMFLWLENIRHPNGQIPLFNDAAHGIAPSYEELKEYASRLKLGIPASKKTMGMLDFPDSGYFKYSTKNYCLIGDISAVGPNHQPGHAHADTLSFELSVSGTPLFVDTGTSTYTDHPRRDIERATTSHNTLSIGLENSSEIWGHHRVARRALIIDRIISESEAYGSHDGYRRIRNLGLHSRKWKFNQDLIEIEDSVEGRNDHEIAIFFHCTPEAKVSQEEDGSIKIIGPNSTAISLKMPAIFSIELEAFNHSPQFGLQLKAIKIIAKAKIRLPQKIRYSIYILNTNEY